MYYIALASVGCFFIVLKSDIQRIPILEGEKKVGSS